MAVLKIQAEFEGPAEKLFVAMADLTKTFGHRYFRELKACSPLNIQVISTDEDQPAKPEPIDPFLVEDIEVLDLNPRGFNCLKRVGIETVGDLVQKTEAELLAIPNFGRPTLEHVIDKLSAHNKELRKS